MACCLSGSRMRRSTTRRPGDLAVIQNYLKIAFRNLLKYRFYTGINISGLTVGMVCFLFIFLYVRDE